MTDRSFPDQNLRNSLIVVSNADGVTPVSLWADPSTHALVTSGGGSGGGGTQYAEGATTSPGTGTLAEGRYNSSAPTLTNGQLFGLQLDSSGNLKVTGSLSVGGTTDEATFTAGTSTFNAAGGVFNDSVANLSSGQQGAERLTAARGVHINLRNNSGTEIGTVANPINDILAVAPTAYTPSYTALSLGGLQLRTDAAGNLQTYSAITTDEGMSRAAFTGSSISYSPGSATFTNNSTAVTTTSGFLSTDVNYLDYIKLSADGETSWAQVSYVNSDTSITLIAPYSGTSTTGAYSVSRVATITGSGATIAVASGQLTMTSGTTTAANTVVYKAAAFPPLPSLNANAQFSLSQRIVNQDIFYGLEAATSGTNRYFARFHFTGTTNTQVITETGYNPTTTPSASETETNTITLPGSATTASINTYEVDFQDDQVLFMVNGTIVATHVSRLPNVWQQNYSNQIRITNGTSPAGSTSVVVNHIFHKIYNRVDVTDGNTRPLLISTAGGYVRQDSTATIAKESGGNLATLAGAVTSAVLQDNIKQINGVTPLMGNGVSGTGSLRVNIASDNTAFSVNAVQSTAATLTAGWPTINGEAADVTGTFTNATQTTSVTANSLDGYGNTLISINGTYGTATAIFEGSDDGGTTWYTVQAARDNTNVIETGYTSLTNVSQTWQINNPGFDSLRVRSTAVASGTVNVRLSSSAAPVASGTIVGIGTAIPTGTNPIGSINLSPTASGGWTPYFANAITTTVAPTAAAGKFGGYMLINLNSAPAYLQVFDTTGAVTLGSTAPTFVIPIPANATAANGLAANVELANGIVIANGIKCAATTTSNGASTVSTGITGTLWVK